jgi:proteasome assembly chaperone (PAC2) family protein
MHAAGQESPAPPFSLCYKVGVIMDTSDVLRISQRPQLRGPVILAAFSGWNDASQVATSALHALRRAWSAERFAAIDAETFFVFSESRPMISLTPSGRRKLDWPSNEFFAHQLAETETDAILLIGTEPQLRWRTFCQLVVDVAREFHASRLITLGGLLADVPHTVEPRLTGFATSPEILPQLQDLQVQLSTYEGPTGIIGALHDAWRTAALPAISLWGDVPHYISATPNPQVTVALLRRVATLLGVELPLAALERKAVLFRQQIDEALRQNPDAQEYVHQLEQHIGPPSIETPGPQLIQELEEFLRRSNPPEDDAQN